LGRTNTNEILAQPHKALTPLSTQNLKAMGLWVLILIWCSTFSILVNVGLRLTLGFLTIFPSLLGIRVLTQVLTTKIKDENKGTKINNRQ